MFPISLYFGKQAESSKVLKLATLRNKLCVSLDTGLGINILNQTNRRFYYTHSSASLHENVSAAESVFLVSFKMQIKTWWVKPSWYTKISMINI